MAIEIEVSLSCNQSAVLSFQEGLIMLHTASTNAQFAPDNTAIEMVLIDSQPLKVGFHSKGVLTYQSWYFAHKDAEKVSAFFESLGYPRMQVITVNERPSALQLH